MDTGAASTATKMAGKQVGINSAAATVATVAAEGVSPETRRIARSSGNEVTSESFNTRRCNAS